MEKNKAKIIAIGGGKGGVGKSFISSNLSIAIAMSGKRTAVIDLDLGGANLHTLLGLKSTERGIGDFIYNPTSQNLMDYGVATGIPNLTLISGNGFIPGIANIEYARKLRVIKAIGQLDADYVVLDLGAGTSYNVIDFFTLTRSGIVVTMHEPTAILNAYEFMKNVIYRIYARDLRDRPEVLAIINDHKAATESSVRQSIETLMQTVGKIDPVAEKIMRQMHADFHPAFIVNMSQSDVRDFSRSLQDICRTYLSIDIHYLGNVPDDPLAQKSCQTMKPLMIDAPNTQTAYTVRTLAMQAMNSTWADTEKLSTQHGTESAATAAVVQETEDHFHGHSDTELSMLLNKFISEGAQLTHKPEQTPAPVSAPLPEPGKPGIAAVQKSAEKPAPATMFLETSESGFKWMLNPNSPALLFSIEPRMRPDSEQPHFMPIADAPATGGLLQSVFSGFMNKSAPAAGKDMSSNDSFRVIQNSPRARETPDIIQAMARITAGNASFTNDWLRTGKILTDTRLLTLAQKAYEAAQACMPKNEAAINNRAAILLMAGNNQLAAEVLNEALKTLHNSWNLRFNLGLAQIGLRQYREAASNFVRARSMLPKDLYLPADFLEGYCLYRIRDFKAAESVFHTIADHEINDLFALFNWGLAQVRCGAFEPSIRTMSTMVKIAPHDAEALTILALANNQCGHYEEALTNLAQAMKQDAGNLTLYMARAAIARQIGRLDLAVSDMQKVMKLVPGNETLQALFAQIQKGIEST